MCDLQILTYIAELPCRRLARGLCRHPHGARNCANRGESPHGVLTVDKNNSALQRRVVVILVT